MNQIIDGIAVVFAAFAVAAAVSVVYTSDGGPSWRWCPNGGSSSCCRGNSHYLAYLFAKN